MGIVYCATNKTNGKIYIGKTINTLQQRQKEHLFASKKKNHYFPTALRKYGIENFNWEIIFESNNEDELNEKEISCIREFDSTDRNKGYNMSFGGEGVRPTEEVRRRISESEKGKIVSQETRKKMSEASKGRIPWSKGIPMTEETKKKVSASRKGIAGPRRKVMCLDTNVVYESMKEAGRQLHLQYKNIQKCCVGERNVCGGFRWAYVGGVY
jgi:group I intron endonuclease